MKYLAPIFLKKGFLPVIFTLLFLNSFCQLKQGILTGKVIDGTTYRTLYNVHVSTDTTAGKQTVSGSDGYYRINLIEGVNIISYYLKGFQKKIITGIKIKEGQPVYLDIILYPTATKVPYKYKYQYKDSARVVDSVVHSFFRDETFSGKYNYVQFGNGLQSDYTGQQNITPGIYKNTSLILKALNGVIVQHNPFQPMLHSFTVSGMGERYNQVIFNGSVLNYFDPLTRAFPLKILPTEIIEEVSVQKTTSGNVPADFAGGSISIKTKDYADKDFYYIQGGAGFSDATHGKKFYGDKRNNLDLFGLSGNSRNLPEDFPNASTRSRVYFGSLNIQEQIYLSKKLKNNLAAITSANAAPNTKMTLGFGKNFKLKNNAKISLVVFFNQLKNQQYQQSTVQVAPNVVENPYPFTALNKTVIKSQSTDEIYQYNAQTSVIINTTLLFGKNKISFKNFAGSQFANAYTKKTNIFKPDEDTLANAGINYTPTQRYFINSQLSGEHILSPNGRFKMDWQATYTFINQQNPDEINLLLRQDLTGTRFEIATPVTNNVFTNSGRLWRKYKDNNFSAALNLSFPFNLIKQPQTLNGGVFIQQNFRVANADLFLVRGSGYFTLSQLLAPERYYPGGNAISPFYINGRVSTSLFLAANQNTKASYSGSLNIGAAYIKLDGRITNFLLYNLGGRMESSNTLSSDIYYNYTPGLRNPEYLPNYKNTKVNATVFLPSASLVLKANSNIQLQATWFNTLNRPQLQELVTYAYYDAASFSIKTGNPILDMTAISNYTTGINILAQSFFTGNVSAFYKKINQPIEYIIENYGAGNILFKPHNTPPAVVKGIEGSLNLKLNFLNISWLSGAAIFANGNIISSKADAGPVRSFTTPYVKEHTLSGTPKYSVNTGVTIQSNRFPQLSVIYSKTGDYINALGSGKDVQLTNGNIVLAIPDYRVKGSEHLDVQVAQKLFKSKFEIIVGANNLLNNPFIIYQDLNGNKKFDSPLVVETINGAARNYKSGVDNTIALIKSQRTYFCTISWLFK
ncbi:TonB-dependent receptor domain-containing protein [Ferruginibacter sp.]